MTTMVTGQIGSIAMTTGERERFTQWANDGLAGRWELGRQRYHQVSSDFQGSPRDHLLEEVLDKVVYMWVERRRLIAEASAILVDQTGVLSMPYDGGAEAWRRMDREAQSEFHEWVTGEIARHWAGTAVPPVDGDSDEELLGIAVFHGLGVLAALWKLSRRAARDD